MKAENIAKYFFNKDMENELFKDELIDLNGHKSFIGNIRINKYLHIAQNTYIAKYSKLLFEDSIYAFDNGGVVENVRKNYLMLKNTKNNIDENIDDETKLFLDKIYNILYNATIDELIQISHEDIEWVNKNTGNSKLLQEMNSIKNYELYKEQYKDVLLLMDKIC